jgi:hypothetical protein
MPEPLNPNLVGIDLDHNAEGHVEIIVPVGDQVPRLGWNLSEEDIEADSEKLVDLSHHEECLVHVRKPITPEATVFAGGARPSILPFAVKPAASCCCATLCSLTRLRASSTLKMSRRLCVFIVQLRTKSLARRENKLSIFFSFVSERFVESNLPSFTSPPSCSDPRPACPHPRRSESWRGSPRPP